MKTQNPAFMQPQNLAPTFPARVASPARHWLFSLPLSMGLFTYLYLLFDRSKVLQDGDTFWHIAAGRWILQNGTVPATDPFSHSKLGSAWTAHEWLSEVVLALTHQLGGWEAVIAITALCFAMAIGLLTRALLQWLEPAYAFLFAGLGLFMAVGHALARPHMLAMPILLAWTIELVRASEANRSPRAWLLPLMTLWANLHGGFTLGIALACAFALEAALKAGNWRGALSAARPWGIFVTLAVAFSLLTPHGPQGLLFTWKVLFEGTYALSRIAEWLSPNFHVLQPLELWLLAGLALVMHQGLRLPPLRLLMLLGLIHLSLKHVRNIELLGLLGPLVVAAPFGAQWRKRQETKPQLERVDRLLHRLSQPAGAGAIVAAMALVFAAPLLLARSRPLELPSVAPISAVKAVQDAGIRGPVLNSYDWGGYLIFSGVPVFIDGRADMYGDSFLKEYVEAMHLSSPRGLETLLEKYKVTWTILPTETPAVTLLDHLPGWRRLHTDKTAIVHVRADRSPHPAMQTER